MCQVCLVTNYSEAIARGLGQTIVARFRNLCLADPKGIHFWVKYAHTLLLPAPTRIADTSIVALHKRTSEFADEQFPLFASDIALEETSPSTAKNTLRRDIEIVRRTIFSPGSVV